MAMKKRKRRSWLVPLRAALLPAVALAVIGYFALHAVIGQSGLLAWRGYKEERVRLESQSAVLTKEKQALQNRAQLLDPRAVDPDLADELVRRDLGVVRPDEVVVPIR